MTATVSTDGLMFGIVVLGAAMVVLAVALAHRGGRRSRRLEALLRQLSGQLGHVFDRVEQLDGRLGGASTELVTRLSRVEDRLELTDQDMGGRIDRLLETILVVHAQRDPDPSAVAASSALPTPETAEGALGHDQASLDSTRELAQGAMTTAREALAAALEAAANPAQDLAERALATAREARLAARELEHDPARGAGQRALETAQRALDAALDAGADPAREVAQRALATAEEALQAAVQAGAANPALDVAERAQATAQHALETAREAVAARDPGHSGSTVWEPVVPPAGDARPAHAPADEPAHEPEVLPPHEPEVVPILALGSWGRFVSTTQSLLAVRGTEPGAIDGTFGPRTEAAVRAFQEAYGLEPDGIVGPRTWTALISRNPSTDGSALPTVQHVADPEPTVWPAASTESQPGAPPELRREETSPPSPTRSARRSRYSKAPARDEAERFLADMLADGPVLVQRLRQEAESAGLSWRTVERAKKRSGRVAAVRRRVPGGATREWYWQARAVAAGSEHGGELSRASASATG